MNNNRIHKKDSKDMFKGIAVVLFWLMLWQLAAMITAMPLILPTPVTALKSLLTLLATGTFYLDVAATIYRCMLGMILSFILGVLCAAIAYKSAAARSLLSLPVNFLKATPVMAVIIYALLLLTSNNVPVFVCFLMCYPVVYINVLSGLDSMEKEYLEMARVFEVNGRDRFRWLYLPSIEPEIKASLNLIAGLSWKSVVAAEVLSVPKFSMGYNLLNSKIYFETGELFAWIISIVALAYAFERVIRYFVRKIEVREYPGSRVLKTAGQGLSAGPGQPVVQINQEESSKEAPKIEIKNLSKRFDNKEVFRNYYLTLEGNKITAIMGPSGAGKTTLLRIISGLTTADSGTVTESGLVASGKTRARISYQFQEDRLLPWLNIYDNLALVLKGKIREDRIDLIIKEALDRMELSSELSKLPDQLSGGMRQRVSMARALAYPAGLLLMDEPLKGLDEALKNRIIEDSWKQYTDGKTVILVTHDSGDAARLADEIITLTKHN